MSDGIAMLCRRTDAPPSAKRVEPLLERFQVGFRCLFRREQKPLPAPSRRKGRGLADVRRSGNPKPSAAKRAHSHQCLPQRRIEYQRVKSHRCRTEGAKTGPIAGQSGERTCALAVLLARNAACVGLRANPSCRHSTELEEGLRERMRILHIVAPGDVGGLERVVLSLAQGQADAGADVHVAVVLHPASTDHAFIAALQRSGATAHPITVPARGYLRERSAILQLARRVAPDVVHTHGCRPDVVDARAIRRLDIPTVTTVHGFVGGDWKNRLYERLQRRAYRRFDAVVVVSRLLRDQLIREGVAADCIHVVQNAWREVAPPFDRATAREALGVGENGFRIGWVGRLSAEKGPDVIVDALARLTDLPITLSMVGDGRERGSLGAHARQLGIERRIRWHGVVPDAARLFAAFDAFVLSSRTEGTPIVLFEAMAAGVPII